MERYTNGVMNKVYSMGERKHWYEITQVSKNITRCSRPCSWAIGVVHNWIIFWLPLFNSHIPRSAILVETWCKLRKLLVSWENNFAILFVSKLVSSKKIFPKCSHFLRSSPPNTLIMLSNKPNLNANIFGKLRKYFCHTIC